jgi:hypothetical protein
MPWRAVPEPFLPGQSAWFADSPLRPDSARGGGGLSILNQIDLFILTSRGESGHLPVPQREERLLADGNDGGNPLLSLGGYA